MYVCINYLKQSDMNEPKKTIRRQFLLELPEAGKIDLSSFWYEADTEGYHLYISDGTSGARFAECFSDSKSVNPEIGRISRMIGTLNDLKEKLQAIKTWHTDRENRHALGVDILPNRKTSMIDEDEPSAPGTEYDF